MDYEKEYNEMVRRCRELHESGNALTKLQMEIVCPELKAQDDESIRKELIDFVNQYAQREVREQFIPWLEKKKTPEREGLYLYHDGEFTSIGSPAWEGERDEHLSIVNKEDAEHYFPELKESEDEKIREAIIGAISTATMDECTRRDCLAYLEKQKDVVEALRTEYEKGRADAIAERNLDNDLFRQGYEIGYEDEKILIRIYKFIEEQYPEEWVEKKTKMLAWLEKQKVSQDPFDNEQFKKGYELGYEDRAKMDKPAAWSENETRLLNEAIQMVESNGTWIRSDDAVKLVSNFLKKLRDSSGKSKEWSEEENRYLDDIEKVIRLCIGTRGYGYPDEYLKDLAFFIHTIKCKRDQIE